MSKESNEELIKLIKQEIDTQDNYEQLYKQNRGFIYLIISKRIHGIHEEEDLMQQAFIALVRAVDYFNPDLEETSFLTLLKYCIWNEIRDLTGEVSANMRNKIYRYRKAKDKLFNELGRQPKNYEIMLEMSIDLKQLEEIKKAYRFSNALSLDMPLNGESATTLIDLYANSQADEDNEFEAKLSNQELRNILDEALNKLSDRQQEVIDKIYYQNMTLKQCGQFLNVSPERVRQLERTSFRELRKDRQLERKLDGYISNYKHIGVQSFNRTGTSSVESVVLDRERRLEEWKSRNANYKDTPKNS